MDASAISGGATMTDNRRYLVSRNKREGKYCGAVKGKYFRLLRAWEILEDDRPRGEWLGFDKDSLKKLLKKNLNKRTAS